MNMYGMFGLLMCSKCSWWTYMLCLAFWCVENTVDERVSSVWIADM